MNILDAYVKSTPSKQNVINLFDGEWSSVLPPGVDLVTRPGTAGLFDDGRVKWAEEVLGSFSGCSVLELGPLEGGHSYMFQTSGASEVVAIEANSRAFLKCLCIKEILGLNKVAFLLGDFMHYLEENTRRFDLIFASGVLYHMDDPVRLLDLISRHTDKVYVWTHYFDLDIIGANERLSRKFGDLANYSYEGFSYEAATQSYGEALEWVGFTGGVRPTSKWLTRDSILAAMKLFGFRDVQVNFQQPDHPNGPAFAFCAKR
jgi:Protein of unknown function (DUF1698)